MAVDKKSVGANVVGYDPSIRQFLFEDRDDEVTAGLVLRYEITVQNHGPSLSQNVTIMDRLPLAPVPGPV